MWKFAELPGHQTVLYDSKAFKATLDRVQEEREYFEWALRFLISLARRDGRCVYVHRGVDAWVGPPDELSTPGPRVYVFDPPSSLEF